MDVYENKQISATFKDLMKIIEQIAKNPPPHPGMVWQDTRILFTFRYCLLTLWTRRGGEIKDGKLAVDELCQAQYSLS